MADILKEHVIHFPTHANDGTRFPKHLSILFQARLLEEFGGFTKHDAKGAWRDPEGGKIHRESMIRYIVATDTHTGTDRLIHLAKWVCTLVNQKCVYVVTPDRGVLFVES